MILTMQNLSIFSEVFPISQTQTLWNHHEGSKTSLILVSWAVIIAY